MTSLTSFEIFTNNLDSDDCSDCSCSCTSSSSEHCSERWEQHKPSDGRPGIPHRQVSSPSLFSDPDDSDSEDEDEEEESCIIVIENLQESLTSPIVARERPLRAARAGRTRAGPVVARTISTDSLPCLPKRQASGRQINLGSSNHTSPCPPRGRRMRTKRTQAKSPRPLARTTRNGPPSLPRRQASRAKSLMASVPQTFAACESPLSMQSCAGSAA